MGKPIEEYTTRELKIEIEALRKIVNTAICKKGCGEVEFGFEGYLSCASCGEEMENQITNAHWKYLKHKITRQNRYRKEGI